MQIRVHYRFPAKKPNTVEFCALTAFELYLSQMTPNDEDEDSAQMRAAIAQMRAETEQSRGYANYFEWRVDRNREGLAELGVVESLQKSLAADGLSYFESVKSRPQPNDPPDCEATDCNGARVAIEVTELVDGEAIRAFKERRVLDWAEWTREKFISFLAERITAKDECYPRLQNPPYEGGYIVVVHTDEPALSRSIVQEYLNDHDIPKPEHVSRVFLLLSYDLAIQRCPYFEVSFNS